jgi:hypothetical protein
MGYFIPRDDTTALRGVLSVRQATASVAQSFESIRYVMRILNAPKAYEIQIITNHLAYWFSCAVADQESAYAYFVVYTREVNRFSRA